MSSAESPDGKRRRIERTGGGGGGADVDGEKALAVLGILMQDGDYMAENAEANASYYKPEGEKSVFETLTDVHSRFRPYKSAGVTYARREYYAALEAKRRIGRNEELSAEDRRDMIGLEEETRARNRRRIDRHHNSDGPTPSYQQYQTHDDDLYYWPDQVGQ